MSVVESPPRVAVAAPLRRRRVVGVTALLVAGLLADLVAMFFTSLLAVLISILVRSETVFIGLLVAFQCANLFLLLVGADRLSRRLGSGRRPLLCLAGVSAYFFSLAGGFDFSVVVFLHDDVPFFLLWARIGVPLAWLLAAVAWAGSCVLSESRRRAGRAYRWPVVAAGFAMAALLAGSWWWVPAAFERGLYSG